ncbi:MULTISPECIES: methionyl-tRNA formyltransferase [Cryobacterium]|uniref:methionyl-tRNA formyltransferase n=1 Tax=Cryobacterium TaxID=69578 RepID=UPI000CD3F8BC|nr:MULTISPECIES: methionyl-tRNA formyltransferase [Cryobacterium]POH65512.1 methionyl-tRNA formyltransferase [Cryobacterium zongtaii]TFC45212.1 methionyl-tRNA formyltransferase [Cryobacterium sp. TMN-39-2]
MKLVFAGTPQVAVPSLTLLASSDHEIAAVVTRPDAALGRKRVLTPSPVAAAADTLGLPVIKANRLDADATAAITALNADLGVIVAYGGLVREPLLSAPRLGWINLHFSLLPRWRGAAPVQRAIMAGDAESGAAVFQLVADLDAGAVFAELRVPIGRHATAGTLLESLSHSGAELLRRVVDDLAAGSIRAVEQSGEVTLAPKLNLADARVDWTLPGERVHAIIRGVTPEPGAFTEIDGARLKLHDVAPAHGQPGLSPGHITLHDKRVLIGTGTEPLELITVQPAGKTPMKALDWWRGVAASEVIAS